MPDHDAQLADNTGMVIGAINPHTGHPYAFNEPVPIDGFAQNPQLLPPFDLNDINPAIDSDDIDPDHSPSDIYDRLFGAPRILEHDADREHRERRKQSITYRQLKRLHQQFCENPDLPVLRKYLHRRFVAKFEPHDRRPARHDYNIIKNPTYSLDYIFAISKEPGLQLIMPPRSTPTWKCRIHPNYMPTFLKDRYAVPTCNLKRKYVRFAETDDFDVFLAFIPRDRDIEQDKLDHPEWFVPLARQGPPPLRTHRRIAISFFLAKLFQAHQTSNLAIFEDYPTAQGEKVPWDLEQLRDYTNFLELRSIEIGFRDMEQANAEFQNVYTAFAEKYAEECDDDFFLNHDAHVMISRFGQDLPMDIPINDQATPSNDVRASRRFFNRHFLRWRECASVSLAIATTFIIDWAEGILLRPRSEWTTGPEDAVLPIGEPVFDVHSGEQLLIDRPDFVYEPEQDESQELRTADGQSVHWYEYVFHDDTRKAGTLVDLRTVHELFMDPNAYRTDDNPQSDRHDARKVPFAKYPMDCEHEVGNIQASGLPGPMQNALDMLNWVLNHGEELDVGDRFVKGYGTQIYNDIAHPMKGGRKVLDTSLGHMTAVSAGYELGEKSLGQHKAKFNKLKQNLQQRLPYETLHAKIMGANGEKRGARCEFNYTIDVAAMMHDHDHVFDHEGAKFYQQVIEPLARLSTREDVMVHLLDNLICLTGELFPGLPVYNSLFVQYMCRQIMTKAVFERLCQDPGTTDFLAVHERILAFLISGNARSMMNFGEAFGLLASLRRKELPSYTNAVEYIEERGYCMGYDYWPIKDMVTIPAAEKAVASNFSPALGKELSTLVNAKIWYYKDSFPRNEDGVPLKPLQGFPMAVDRCYKLMLLETRSWAVDTWTRSAHNDLSREALKAFSHNTRPFNDHQELLYIRAIVYGDINGDGTVWDTRCHPNAPMSFLALVRNIIAAATPGKKSVPPRLVPGSLVPALIQWFYKILQDAGLNEISATNHLTNTLVDIIQGSGLNMWPAWAHVDGRKTLTPDRWLFLSIPTAEQQARTESRPIPVGPAQVLAEAQQRYASQSSTAPWSLLDTPLTQIEIIYIKSTFPEEWKQEKMMASTAGGNKGFAELARWALSNVQYDNIIVKDVFVIVRLLAEIHPDRDVTLNAPRVARLEGAWELFQERPTMNYKAANAYLRNASFARATTRHKPATAQWMCQRVLVILAYVLKDCPAKKSREFSTATNSVKLNGWTMIKLGITEFAQRDIAIDPWAVIVPHQSKANAKLRDLRIERESLARTKPTRWLSKVFHTIVVEADMADIPEATLDPEDPLTPPKRKRPSDEEFHPSQQHYVDKARREYNQSGYKRIRRQYGLHDSQNNDMDIDN